MLFNRLDSLLLLITFGLPSTFAVQIHHGEGNASGIPRENVYNINHSDYKNPATVSTSHMEKILENLYEGPRPEFVDLMLLKNLLKTATENEDVSLEVYDLDDGSFGLSFYTTGGFSLSVPQGYYQKWGSKETLSSIMNYLKKNS